MDLEKVRQAFEKWRDEEVTSNHSSAYLFLPAFEAGVAFAQSAAPQAESVPSDAESRATKSCTSPPFKKGELCDS